MTLDEITRYLHDHFPVTRGMGARAERYDGRSVRLAAPLGPNVNQGGTAFGGSLSALAILSGWTLVHLLLEERGASCRLVIQRSALDFEAPVDGDFTATAILPAEPVWSRFLATLSRHRRARVSVFSSIECASGTGGWHEGTYAALRI